MKNEKTEIDMFKIEGTFTLSNDPSDYGDNATEADVEAYCRYINDHTPINEVEMGASWEAGFMPRYDNDDDQEAGDEWLADMWARYPEHEAKYR